MKAAMAAASALILTLTMAASAHAATITFVVEGTSNIWLAGMPEGTTASPGPGSISDVSLDQSPLHAAGLPLNGGDMLTFLVTGGVSNTPVCCSSIEGETPLMHVDGAEHGISDVMAPLNTLLGVFLDGTAPNLSAAPAMLDFSPTALGLDFPTLAPELKQVFFIGNGSTSGGVQQTFVVPDGATRLFLGTMDGYGWYNNSGSFTVEIYSGPETVPEPSTVMLLGAALVVMGSRRLRRRNTGA